MTFINGVTWCVARPAGQAPPRTRWTGRAAGAVLPAKHPRLVVRLQHLVPADRQLRHRLQLRGAPQPSSSRSEKGGQRRRSKSRWAVRVDCGSDGVARTPGLTENILGQGIELNGKNANKSYILRGGRLVIKQGDLISLRSRSQIYLTVKT
jgi:hypothetical protein